MIRSNFSIRACVALTVLALAGPALAQDQPKTKTPEATQVTLADLEAAPDKYAGKTVTVTGEVSDILGPRLFTIDSGRLFDFHGDTVVVVPAPLAALLDEDTSVTITGMVQPLVDTTIQREYGWFSDDPTIVAEIKERSGLVAQTITTMKDGGKVALTVDLTGTPRMGAVQTDLAKVAAADRSMVGQYVQVEDARVESVNKDGGFWVSAGQARLFVLPESGAAKFTPGQSVRVEGVVLPFADAMKARMGAYGPSENIYVYARQVAPAT